MPDDLLRALWDPTAPLPAIWPTGAWGVFLLFLIPIGGGIPFGVLMARDAGLSPLVTALLYFLSDVVAAPTNEPILILLRWLARRVPPLGRLGDRLARLSDSAGLQDGGVRGPLGLILVSFSISLGTGRAAAAAAGHGFLAGWTLAIIGDMAFFGLLLVSTLWVSSVTGNDRLTIGIALLMAWVLPLVVRRMRRRPGGAAQPQPASMRVAPAPAAVVPLPRPTSNGANRRRTAARRRPTRGLHR